MRTPPARPPPLEAHRHTTGPPSPLRARGPDKVHRYFRPNGRTASPSRRSSTGTRGGVKQWSRTAFGAFSYSFAIFVHDPFRTIVRFFRLLSGPRAAKPYYCREDTVNNVFALLSNGLAMRLPAWLSRGAPRVLFKTSSSRVLACGARTMRQRPSIGPLGASCTRVASRATPAASS